MTNRCYGVEISKLIYEDVKAHEKTSENSENLR